MKRAEQIEHKGVVLSIDGGVVRVAIEVMEACGSCASRKACAMGMSDKREITVYTDQAERYAIGEVVNVSVRQSMGAVAVVLCYVAPLVVLVAALGVASAVGISEGLSAVISLGMIALYYAIIYLLRNRISKKMIFTIDKLI